MHLSADEVRRYVTDFLEGRGSRWQWDDFISVPLDDPELEAIRRLCGSVRDRFPPTSPGHYCSEEGFNELRRLVRLLGNGNLSK